MVRGVLVSALVMSLAGCATGAIDQSLLSKPGVETSRDGHGNVYIESVEIEKQGHSLSKDAMQFCLAQNVDNPSVTMSGSSSSYTSPFTGRTYSSSETVNVAGGDAVKFVSQDGSQAVAKGVERYESTTLGMTNQRFLRYQLSIKADGQATKYHFGNLEQAFEDSGVANVTGFDKVGAWSSAGPETTYAVIEKIAERVSGCLSSQ